MGDRKGKTGKCKGNEGEEWRMARDDEVKGEDYTRRDIKKFHEGTNVSEIRTIW